MKTAAWDFDFWGIVLLLFAPVMLTVEKCAEDKSYGVDQCGCQGPVYVGTQLEWLREGAGTGRMWPLLQPAASSRLTGFQRDFPRGSVQIFAAAREEEKCGATQKLTVTLLSYCWAVKTNWEQRGWICSLCGGLWWGLVVEGILLSSWPFSLLYGISFNLKTKQNKLN